MKAKNIISTIIISCIASSIGFSAHAIIDAVTSSQKVFVDNQEVAIEAYNIAGNNYYKLRDLGDTLGFSVDYDERSNAVMITTDEADNKDTDGTITNDDELRDEDGYLIPKTGNLINRTPEPASGSTGPYSY